jgi:uncharacterized protein YdhG (YjbR/CyaY superfamily)
VAAVQVFLDTLEEPTRGVFSQLRDVALEVVPDAEEGTSYGLAALTYRGKPLLGFRAARQHLSLYPFSSEVVDTVRERLAGFATSKGTIRFNADDPLPEDVVRDLVRLRLAEITG